MKVASRRVAGAPRRPRRGPGRPPGPSQAVRVREALVAAATQQYAEGGRAGISFAALGAAVGLRKATVFHYFPTKDALVRAVFEALGTRLADRCGEWFGTPGRAYAERVEHLVGSLVDFYESDPVHARVICHGLLEVQHVPASGAEPSLGGFVSQFVEFLRGGVATGELHPADPAGTMMAIGGVILFELMIPPAARRAYGRGGRTAARRAELVAFVRRGLVNGGGA